MQRTLGWLILCTLIGAVVLSPSVGAQHAPPGDPDGHLRSHRLGITFINSADHPADDERYRRALLLGAGWNRWPLYWSSVESAPGVYTWGENDRVVAADLAHGLRSSAILLGIPDFYRAGGGIRALAAPIFSDGTDIPGVGKRPNPSNPWAMFVSAAVERYRPGGALAQQLGWPPGWGVSVWEAWNEPDLTLFWQGGVPAYARLLKVTYLVVKQVDPGARVLFGGLAYGDPRVDDWLAQVLAIYADDPLAAQYNYFFDIAALHSYSDPYRSALLIEWARGVLSTYGLDHPIWLNETGLPVWDDYPGPVWTADQPSERIYRGTLREQAHYMILNTAFALAAGAEIIFVHQLYDDCGNQSSGTDFPPHNGELCTAGACWGDAHGLFRNGRDAICFSQHPLPGTPRPATIAYHLTARVFGTGALANGQIIKLGADDAPDAYAIAFDRPIDFGPIVGTPQISERLYVLWNPTPDPLTLTIPASGAGALLYTAEAAASILTPQNGVYTVNLPTATDPAAPLSSAPLILTESVPSGVVPVDPALINAEGTLPTVLATAAPQPVLGAPIAGLSGEPPPATLDPALDRSPPTTAMSPLPAVSPPTFTLVWSGADDSGIAEYIVWVRVDGGDWSPWLQTAATLAEFTGEAGRTYDFAVWARDLAGNWSANVDLTPQASTSVR
ncbi:MAG: hypothetical protein GYB67_19000 [Chloroflexi bacterium]|nr:hypothetical protein [Chloroflexota bacterium]